MLIVHRTSTNPYFNLAAEEYLVKNLQEPCFMLWQNTPSVIIGKHQNPLREVNLEFVEQNHIPVIRRISGGGTVYHDLGNLNYSFIDFGKAESLVNFPKYSQPVLSLLHKLGVPAQLSGKSDLTIHGLKFSGNASHVYRQKVLHHGTLLFQSNLDILNESIKIKRMNISDKAVNSNRSQITNIAVHLPLFLSIEEFKLKLTEEIIQIFPNTRYLDFSETQLDEINQLAEEKYKSWEWNFGYGPKYEINSIVMINNQMLDFCVLVNKGFIQNITSTKAIPENLQKAIQICIGLQHHKDMLIRKLKSNFDEEINQWMQEILF